MDKKESEIQKALGTLKLGTFRVSFTFRRKNDPKRLRYYEKKVYAYTKEDAIKKVLGKFSTDPKAGPGQFRDGDGCCVRYFDPKEGKRGKWVIV